MAAAGMCEAGVVTDSPPTTRVVSTTLATRHGRFQIHAYAGAHGTGPVALTLGDPAGQVAYGLPPLARVHSECLTGDVLGSWRCDCGDQLEAALGMISRAGCGILVYLRGHEGRGIGLEAKLRAYALQDQGLDTVEANVRLGYPVDARDYQAAADVLRDLGAHRVRLLSGNPDKSARLAELGIEVVSRQQLPVGERAANRAYLRTKRTRMGHDDPGRVPDVWAGLLQRRVPIRARDVADSVLLDRYGWLAGAGPRVVVGQLAHSADGFIATRAGDADALSGPEDHEHLHRLRALVDAVVVGATTVAADNPRLTTRAVTGPSPTRVVLDPQARIPRGSRLLTDGAAPTLWLIRSGARVPGRLPSHVVPVECPAAGAGRFAPGGVLELLTRRGLGRVLVEGGGRTLSAFLTAGLLDRLYLTTVPVFLGDGVPGIRFAGAARVTGALTAPVRRFPLGRDLCTEFDLAARPAPG